MGFEPTWEQAPHLISSQRRYGRFGTSPSGDNIILLKVWQSYTMRVGFTRAIPGARPSGAQKTCVQIGNPADLSNPHDEQAPHLISSQRRYDHFGTSPRSTH